MSHKVPHNLFAAFSLVLLACCLASTNASSNRRSTVITKRQYNGGIWWYWSIDTPTPGPANQNSPDIYDFRSQGDDKWVDIDWSDAGIVLENGPPYQVGYRLINDPASSIIYHLSSDFGSAVTSSDTGDYGDIGGPSISMYASIDTSYPSTTAVSNQGTDPWSSTNLTTVTASKSWSILNSECNGSMNYTVITVDAHGTVKTYFGTDYLAGNVPTALPANVTFTNGNDTEVVEFYFTGVEPVSAVWGSAYLPIPNPSFSLQLQYCPD